MRRRNRALSRPIGKTPFEDTRAESWARREKNYPLKGHKGKYDQGEVLFLERILFYSFKV
jgi:hypothetical protein